MKRLVFVLAVLAGVLVTGIQAALSDAPPSSPKDFRLSDATSSGQSSGTQDQGSGNTEDPGSGATQNQESNTGKNEGSDTASAGAVPTGYKLFFADEFNGTGLPNPDHWDYDVSYVRNNELQCYTDGRTQNVRQQGGNLVLTLRKETWKCPQDGNKTYGYTSGSIRTRARHKGDFLVGPDPKKGMPFGIYEIRAKVPRGRGVWPAIWLVGGKKPTAENGWETIGWPDGGEIDIMEYVGYEPEKDGRNRLHSTLHRNRDNFQWPHGRFKTGQGMVLDLDEHPADSWHVWKMIWKPGSLEFFVDGVRVTQMTMGSGKYANKQGFYRSELGTSDPNSWPFDKSRGNEFEFILNLAWGGGWGGWHGVDDSLFARGPVEFLVDYVRVYVPK